VIHHAGKGGQQRGTSRREDVLDTVIALRRPSDYEPDQGARFAVHLEKARGIAGPDAEPFEAKLVIAPDGGATWAMANLRDAQRDKAQVLLREGISIRDVAEEVGMSRSAVHRIKKAMGATGAADG
jgi:putative DNA primase/helicase